MRKLSTVLGIGLLAPALLASNADPLYQQALDFKKAGQPMPADLKHELLALSDRPDADFGQRQGGDDHTTAEAIPGLPYFDSGSTAGLTNSIGPLSDNSGVVCAWTGFYSATSTCLGADAWYSFTLASDTEVYVSLCGSGFDTGLAIFSDPGGGAAPDVVANLVAGNDDSCSLQSEVTCLLSAGSYYLVVDGYSTAEGAYTLAMYDAAVELDPPVITHTPLGNVPDTDPGPYVVSADVTDASGLSSINLIYDIGGGDVTEAMGNVGGDTYEFGIPAQPTGTSISYRIEAQDASANMNLAVEGPFSFGVTGILSTFPLEETFDGGIPGGDWINGPRFWSTDSDGTGSSGTGASEDHTGGGTYAYTEASSYNNTDFVLDTPVMDLSGLTAPVVSCWLHMYGVNMGTFSIDVYDTVTMTWTDDIYSISGQQQSADTDPWFEAVASLAAFQTNPVVVRFHGFTGPGYESDICLDDIFIGEPAAFDAAVTLVSYDDPIAAGFNSNVDLEVANVGASAVDVEVFVDMGLGASSVFVGNLGVGVTQPISVALATPGTPGNYSLDVEVVTVQADGAPGNNTDGATYDTVDNTLPPTNLLASDAELDQITLTWDAPAWFPAPEAPTGEISADDLPFEVPADISREKLDELLRDYAAAHPYWWMENSDRAFLNYNIYRDGGLVGTTAVPGFVDDLGNGVVVGQTYSYTVTALWDEGETVASNADDGTAVARPTSGGPDALGYTWVNSDDDTSPATFDWVEISGIGTDLNIAGDDAGAEQALPFAFPFYSGAFSTAWASSNGYLTFDSADFTDYSNDPVPNATLPNNAIFPLWDDLVTSSQGNIYFYDDSAMNNRVIFQWNDVPRLAGDGTFTFQLILNSDGTFKVQYLSIAGNTASATVGCENSDATIGLQVNNEDAGGTIADNVAIDFAPGAGDFIAPTIDHTQPFVLIEAEAGATTISATITDDSGIDSATLTYDNGGGDTPVAMADMGGGVYEASIPAQIAGTSVSYSISATDNSANMNAGSVGPFSFDVSSTAWTVNDLGATDGGLDETVLTWSLPTDPGTLAASVSNPWAQPEIATVDGKDHIVRPAHETADNGRELDQFNIYRDGVLAGSTGDFTFTDNAANGAVEGVEYSYTIRCVWSGTEYADGNADLGSFVGRPTSGGPDTFGYTWINSNDPMGPPVAFTDISADLNAVAVALTDDDSDGPFTMSSGFPFYGVDQTECYIGSNGIITFGIGSSSLSNTDLPSASAPGDLIAMFWDDLDLGDGVGTVHYLDDVANSRFIVQFTGVPEFPGPGGAPHTFQAILNADGTIEINLDSQGAGADLLSATLGIQNVDGTDGLAAHYNNVGGTVLAGTSYLFSPPAAQEAPVVTITYGSNQVTLNWNDVGASSYDVYGASSAYGPFVLLTSDAGLSESYPVATAMEFFYIEANFE